MQREQDEKEESRCEAKQDPRKEWTRWCKAASRKGRLEEFPNSSGSVYMETN